MKEIILDLHTHSKYSRSCSKELVLPTIAKACEKRGIDIVATGDFTHPAWFEHLTELLVEDTPGLYRLRDDSSPTRFIVGTEVASIKKHGEVTRRVHHLLFAPTLEIAGRFTAALVARGINVRADGRPIIGFTSKQILEIMLETDPHMVMIPAHAWTPWFGVFGSKGGHRTLDECYEDLTPHIFAIETGLSSDPAMNWQYSHLDQIALISNSDAHSPQKLGREANVFGVDDGAAISYDGIMKTIRERNPKNFLYTIEFYPEEGKYHLDGHRDCNFVCTPTETARLKGLCPKCQRPLVIGVMNRISELADRTAEATTRLGRIPYRSMVPLPEIIGDALSVGVASKKVAKIYEKILQRCGSEFFTLLHASLPSIAAASTPQIADAVARVREGRITITPGYDGVFGVVKVFGRVEDRGGTKQGALFLE